MANGSGLCLSMAEMCSNFVVLSIQDFHVVLNHQFLLLMLTTAIFLLLALFNPPSTANFTPSTVRQKAMPADSSRHPVQISAHRGANAVAPENTLAAFQLALEQGANYLELDVRTTRDGQLVILHDSQLDRTTTGSGPVADKTLAELKQLSAGKKWGDAFANEPIPTLVEVCRLLANWNASHAKPACLYVDCKAVAPTPLLQVLHENQVLGQCVFYGSDAFLLALKEADATTKRMPALNNAADIGPKIEQLKPYAFDVRWSILQPSLVQTIHEQGVLVFSDALGLYETPEQYRRAAQMGVDLIQTDHVLRVQQALANKPKE
jgi:glycerophosphoryl diester phosphodiesterase